MNAARKALEGWTEDRWCQGYLFDLKGRTCLMGRIFRTCLNIAEHERALVVTHDVIHEQYDIDGIAPFNDTAGRTFAEVQAVLEKAAVRLDEGVDWG